MQFSNPVVCEMSNGNLYKSNKTTFGEWAWLFSDRVCWLVSSCYIKWQHWDNVNCHIAIRVALPMYFPGQVSEWDFSAEKVTWLCAVLCKIVCWCNEIDVQCKLQTINNKPPLVGGHAFPLMVIVGWPAHVTQALNCLTLKVPIMTFLGPKFCALLTLSAYYNETVKTRLPGVWSVWPLGCDWQDLCRGPSLIRHCYIHVLNTNQKTFFLFLNQNTYCGYSKEPSQWDGSFEHPKIC